MSTSKKLWKISTALSKKTSSLKSSKASLSVPPSMPARGFPKIYTKPRKLLVLKTQFSWKTSNPKISSQLQLAIWAKITLWEPKTITVVGSQILDFLLWQVLKIWPKMISMERRRMTQPKCKSLFLLSLCHSTSHSKTSYWWLFLRIKRHWTLIRASRISRLIQLPKILRELKSCQKLHKSKMLQAQALKSIWELPISM